MNPYLLDVSAALGAINAPPPEPTLDMPADTITPTSSRMAAPPAVYNAPAPAPAWAPPDPIAGLRSAPPPNKPGAGVMTGYDPLADREPATPATAPVGPPPPPPVNDAQPPIARVSGGGMLPAHEASRLGPTQWAALEAGNQAQEQAIGGMVANNEAQAASADEMYMRHALDARQREEAANQVALAREDELRSRASDFDRQARTLAQEKIDPGRFWASRSTPQKVASFISIALGGFLSGARGGENLAWTRVNEEIERDVRAQELSFQMRKSGLEASHTAYGMAMQRYQSADAARAFARVSAMDAVAAEVARQQAHSKNAEGQNRAIAALAELQQARADQVMKGVQYIPSQFTEARYRVANRLGTYTAKEIDKMVAEEEGRGFELQKIDRHADADLRKEGAKQGHDDAKYIATSLQQAGVPQAMESAEIARKALLSDPKGYGERVAENMPLLGNETARKTVFGQGAADREQAWTNYKNQAMKALMGNVTAGEETRANKALEGASDNESRLAAIKTTEAILQAAERNIRKGASDKGNADYDARERGTSGAKPLSNSIKSFQPSKVQ